MRQRTLSDKMANQAFVPAFLFLILTSFFSSSLSFSKENFNGIATSRPAFTFEDLSWSHSENRRLDELAELSPKGFSNSVEFFEKKMAVVGEIISLRGQLAPSVKRLQSLSKAKIEIDATRNKFLKSVYRANYVRASSYSMHLFDKMIASEVIQKFGGEKIYRYYPKTMGLKQFLHAHDLLNKDNQIAADRDQIKSKLDLEFPKGFIVKPASGMNSFGKSKGFFFKMDEFIEELVSQESFVYQPAQFKEPFFSEITGKHLSGEMLIIQENVLTAAGHIRPLEVMKFKEVRLHTYEHDVLDDATSPRWGDGVKASKMELANANEFVSEFLSLLPYGVVAQQAWSIDVAVMDNGVMRIIELNTNRGRKSHWSGFLNRPKVIASYAKYFEEKFNVKYEGISGWLLTNGFANYWKWRKKLIAEATPGWPRIKAQVLPPWPF